MDGYPALIRVQMPDRPGALGLVASRIGALKADIVAIEILDRIGGHAYDEIAVVLPDPDLVGVLIREIEEVDGAQVDSVRLIDTLPEPRLEMLRVALALASAPTVSDLTERLLAATRALGVDWAGIVDGERVVSIGSAPSSREEAAAAATCTVPVGGAQLALARERELSDREQACLLSLCELAAVSWARLDA
jgi:hypothetical protein